MVSLLFVCWFLASAVDDLMILLAWAWTLVDRRDALPVPSADELVEAPEQRIAILVPAWREHAVIARMLEQNLATIRYGSYVFLVGTYPNDGMTQEAVRSVASRDPRVRLVVGPKPGPTSKADCLNAVYRRMTEIEAAEGRFDLVMIHDAEDVLHPDELRHKNWYGERYDMVQTAVLPFATPWTDWTHGVYCDDFAEYHTKDMRARNWLGGFVPSCGVATAFARSLLDQLERGNASGEPFEPGCLTEDYELGYRLHRLGARQVFLPIPAGAGAVMATREFFPQNLRAAVRQRSRWITGIAFQGWRNHGWGKTALETYWFWRDRKGLAGCPMSLAANVMLAVWAITGWRMLSLDAAPRGLLFAVGVLTASNLAVRSWCSAHVYGWQFGALAPARQVWGNVINSLAVFAALASVLRSAWTGQGLAWRKTDHALPWIGEQSQTRSLAEVLIGRGWITKGELEAIAASRRQGISLAESLWRTGRLSPEQVQQARNEQYGLLGAECASAAARLLPAEVAEKWRVIPVGIRAGEIHLASVGMPPLEMRDNLKDYTRLRPRLIFVTPTQYGMLRSQFHRQSPAIEKKLR